MIYRKEGISMGSLSGSDEFIMKVADKELIMKIINILKMI
jgi:hypothetical protein